MDNKFQKSLENIGYLRAYDEQGDITEHSLKEIYAEDFDNIQELIDIASTPVCEDCEPKDLETAKIKLRLMADECNRQTHNLLEEIKTLQKERDHVQSKLSILIEKCIQNQICVISNGDCCQDCRKCIEKELERSK